MSTEFFNDQWRIPSNENQNKVSNYSMEFDHLTNNSISIGNTLTNGFSQLTVSVWVNFSSFVANKNYGLVSKDLVGQRSFDLRYINGTGVNFLVSTNGTGVSGSSYYPVNSINIGQWYHFVGVYDGSNVLLYVDGTLTGTPTALTGSLQNTTSGFFIGKRAAAPTTTTFDGKIDQVSVFNYALSASQVSTLNGGGTAVTNPMSLSPKPIAYYQLGDQSVYNGANYLVPNNSLDGYVFKLVNPNDGINVPASTDFNFGTGDFTISMWFKINSFATYPYLFDFRTPPSFTTPVLVCYISTVTNRIQVSNGVSGIISATTGTVLQTGVWYNFIFKRSSGTCTSHFNGGSADQTATDTSNYNTTPKLNIGIRYDNVNGFDGEMSNFQIFNTALPQTGANSIETIYNGGTPLASMSGFTSLVAWWKLNEDDSFNSATSTWTFNDYAGSNDGTSVSMDSSSLVLSNLTKGTSGYSPYALDFDGIDDYLDTPQINLGSTNTISFWINNSATNTGTIFGDPNAFGTTPYALVQSTSTSELTFRLGNNDNGYWRLAVSSGLLNDGNWHHHCLSRNGVTINYYIDGTLQTNVTNNTLDAYAGTNTTIEHIMANTTLASFASGKLSNVALWTTELTSTEVTEIYNEGVPSDLNNFSGTAPVSWWQLGSNSSYNSGAWTCLDEIGTDNAVSSANMTNSDIVDGVGYSASGLGTSSIDIVGDAPYSSANGISEGMDVLDRTTDVPS